MKREKRRRKRKRKFSLVPFFVYSFLFSFNPRRALSFPRLLLLLLLLRAWQKKEGGGERRPPFCYSNNRFFILIKEKSRRRWRWPVFTLLTSPPPLASNRTVNDKEFTPLT